jgi:hypothetical protein
MYRAAIEQLLHDQGFDTGMLTAKIKALNLEAAIAAGTAPRWAHNLDPAFLKVIKDLSNGSIHPNGGDISKPDALDTALLRHLHETVLEVLDLVHEQPAQRAKRLAALKGAADILR